MTAKKSFKKQERLCHVKTIDSLFNKNKAENLTFLVYPLKVVFQRQASNTLPPKILVSVPKRRFKKAVDRNRLKTQIREAYRLSKTLLHEPSPTSIAFVYVANEPLPYAVIEQAMQKSMSKRR